MIGTTNTPGLKYSQITGITDQIERKIAKMNNVQRVTFSANSWTENTTTNTYTQTLNNFTGYQGDTVTADDKPEVFYVPVGYTSAADLETYAEECGYITSVVTGEGTLTATAYAPPTMNIYADIKGV